MEDVPERADDRRAAPARLIPTTRVRGRMSAAKQRALDDLMPRLGLPGEARPGSEHVRSDAACPDGELGGRLDAAFGRRTRRLLDVGVGSGEATVDWAAAHPERDVLAVELHRPSVALALMAVDAAGLTNVRVAEVDVRLLLAAAAPGAIHDVRLLFPDPWPKRRHLGRRLVDDDLAAVLARVLPSGGTVHVATDWDDYATRSATALSATGRFTVTTDGPRPPRPVTTYEQRGLDAGRTITDLVATRLP